MKQFFPVFSHHPELIFLDSAASVQKPEAVLEAVKNFSEKSYANISRGNYPLSLAATDAFEKARKNVSEFLGAENSTLIFTKNGTEASNIIANALKDKTQKFLEKDDEILMPVSEHHATIVPWQKACEEAGAKITWVYPNSKTGEISEKDFAEKISDKTRYIVFAHVANVTGQIFPAKKIQELAEKNNITTICDACQSVPHLPFHFEELGLDVAFFTGHKIGAGGTGGLLFSQKFLENFPEISPLLYGGDMIRDVTENGFEMQKFPENFEAGTPPIEHIIGLSAAVDFLKNEAGGMQYVSAHTQNLVKYALENFQKFLPNWKIVGPLTSEKRSGNFSFYHPNIHHADVGEYLGAKNIAVRTGFHCANPLHHHLKISGTVRASFWVYSEKSEIDVLIKILQEIEQILG